MFRRTPTTELEDLQDLILPAITAALVTTTSIAWKTAQRLFNRLAATDAEYGAAAYSQSGV